MSLRLKIVVRTRSKPSRNQVVKWEEKEVAIVLESKASLIFVLSSRIGECFQNTAVWVL